MKRMALVCCLLAGCTNQGGNADTAALRGEVAALEKRVEQLEKDNQELQETLKDLRDSYAAASEKLKQLTDVSSLAKSGLLRIVGGLGKEKDDEQMDVSGLLKGLETLANEALAPTEPDDSRGEEKKSDAREE